MPPMKPSSSARIAKTKSVVWTGRKPPWVCVPFVRPLPIQPPEPTAICAWYSWKPAPWMSGLVSRNESSRCLLVVAQEVGPGDRDQRDDARGEDGEPAQARPGHPEHPGEDRAEDERGPEVRLEHDQGERRPDEQARAEDRAERIEAPCRATPGSWRGR